MSASFATPSELAAYTGSDLPSPQTRWQSHLDAASALIRGFTDQVLSVVLFETVVLEPVERETIVLPERPVTAIASITVSGQAFTAYRFTRAGLIHTLNGTTWSMGATVVYSHGYDEDTDALKDIKSVCMDVAARSLLLNVQGASQALGGLAMETVGFAPMTFLTDGEKYRLADHGMVPVG